MPNGPLSSEFESLRVDGVLRNWEASLFCGVKKMRKVFSWAPPSEGVLKFNVDGTTGGNLGQRVLVGCFTIVKALCCLYSQSMWVVWSLMRPRLLLF